MAKREFLRLLKRARDGEAAAQLIVARIYLSGNDNTTASIRAALLWLNRAANQQQDAEQAAEAHWLLFGLYHEGVHVQADPFAALDHARSAADLGHEQAEEWLAMRGKVKPRTPPEVRQDVALRALLSVPRHGRSRHLSHKAVAGSGRGSSGVRARRRHAARPGCRGRRAFFSDPN